jgi:hypothetical protein
MVRFLLAAFVATFIAAIAAVIGVPVMAQDAAPAGADTPDGRHAKLMAMDTDHDGKWSKAEWLAGGRKERSFDLMDTNHDGFLTVEELKTGRAKMKAAHEAIAK